MPFRLLYIALAASLLATAPARAGDQDEALRPEVGKPLQAAEGLIKQQKFADALAQLRKAEAAAPLSPRETALLEQLRGIAAAGSGDNLAAAKAYEAAIAAGKPAGAEMLRLTQAVSVLYYQAKDYPDAIIWAKRSIAAGGNDEQTRTLLAQSYYLAEDWPNAATALKDQIGATERAGRTPSETQLKLLASVAVRQNDTAGYQATLEKLVAAYPRPEYWADLIQRVRTRPGFPHRLTLDVYRLSLAVGVLPSASEVTEAAELALQAGLPGEGKTLLDRGFSADLLGRGPEADRQKRLLALAAQKSADDLRSLSDSEREAATAKDGTGLVNTGLDYLGHGQPQKAVPLIEQGLARGVAKNPDDARLHLGIALYAAGQKDKSIQTFRSVQGGDAADLARLWAIHCGSRSS